MGTTLGGRLGAAALLLTVGFGTDTAAAGDVLWDTGCGASLQGDDLVLVTCEGTFGCEIAQATAWFPVPGTLWFDMDYALEAEQGFTQFTAIADGGGTFTFGAGGDGSWCAPAPCTGRVNNITIPVVAGDRMRFMLSATATGCPGENGTLVTLADWTFVPEPGILDLGLALDAALLHEIVPLPGNDNTIVGSVAMVGDADGDARDDYVYSIVHPTPNRVRLVSGRFGVTLSEATLPGSSSLGALSGAGDVDADGHADYAYTHKTYPSTFNPTGRVYVRSGATGQVLHVLDGAEPNASFGGALAGIGDVDGDGHDDLAVGASLSTLGGFQAGAVFVLSGDSGASLHTVLGQPGERLGAGVRAAGDVDLDGVPDFVVLSTWQQIARVVSGADGSEITSFTAIAVDGAGDFDADGTPDFVAGRIGDEVVVLSGADGSVLATHVSPFLAVRGAGDLDGDGFDDVLIVPPPAPQHDLPILALGGPDGHSLGTLHSPRHRDFGWSIATGGDLGADGRPDVVVAARDVFDAFRVLAWSADPADNGAPVLHGSGALTAGSTVSFTLSGGPPSGSAALVLGAGLLLAPFQGGTLVPTADIIVFGLPLDGSGGLAFDVVWPAGLSGPVVLPMQMWMTHPGAASGFVSSNALGLALD